MPRIPLGDPSDTLGQMRRQYCWVWVRCLECSHDRPVAIVPFIIRWGADAPVNRLRTNLRCSKCGHRGVGLQTPSWGLSDWGDWAPFPVERM